MNLRPGFSTGHLRLVSLRCASEYQIRQQHLGEMGWHYYSVGREAVKPV